MKVVLLGIASLALVACSGGDNEGDIATWAAEVCDVAETVASGTPNDGVDPSTLDLEARKSRSAAMVETLLTLYDDAATDLDAIDPPAAVRDYHDALTRQAEEIRDGLKESEGRLEAATDATGIEAENARLGVLLARTDAEVREAAEDLPADAVAALRSVGRCGELAP